MTGISDSPDVGTNAGRTGPGVEIKFAGDMQRVEVREGDLFVYKSAVELNADEINALYEYWALTFEFKDIPKLIVLKPGDELGVMGMPATIDPA